MTTKETLIKLFAEVADNSEEAKKNVTEHFDKWRETKSPQEYDAMNYCKGWQHAYDDVCEIIFNMICEIIKEEKK